MSLQTVEIVLEKVIARTFIPLIAVVLLGLLLRIYFTPWQLPSNSPDAFVFLIESLSYAKGDFGYFSTRFIWPLFSSMFFVFFKFDEYFGYVTLMRVISISVSVATVPILYLVARQFVEKKYAIIASIFFTVESNLVENSIFAISEPIFILLGLTSFYFSIHKNEKYLPLAFVFAGLAFDTRLNGIVLLFVTIVACVMKIKSRKKLSVILLIGIAVFTMVSSPHIFMPLKEGFTPFLYHFTSVKTMISGGTASLSTYDPSEFSTPFNILKNALKNEFLHIFRISIPYIAILFPFGIIVALRDLDYSRKILFVAIFTSLIIALPQYTISNEYRNLFFLTPLFCILSAIGIQKIVTNVEMKNIFLILLIAGLVLLSGDFLRERYDVDKELIMERDSLGKYIANNLHGKIIGDLRLDIIRNMPNVRIGAIDGVNTVYNQQLSVLSPDVTFDTIPKLRDYLSQNKVDFLVVGNNLDKHSPVFEKILHNEKDFPFLEQIFDSDENGFKKLKLKIFKINYAK